MVLFLNIVIFIFGTIIGSFLNVVLYRLHTGRSLNGRSHCMSCGKMLTWYELFPLFSYLLQRGRCRGCSAYVPSRYFFVEFVTGLSYLLLWLLFASDILLFLLHTVLLSLCVLILVYDIRHTIIPDELTILVFVCGLALLGYTAQDGAMWATLLSHFVAGVGVSAFFVGLWYITKRRGIGLGDAKLALPLGMIVGLQGVFSMVVLSFWVGTLIMVPYLIVLRILKRGKIRLHFRASLLTMKSEVPFAPFLIGGFLLVHLFHADVFTLIDTLLSSWI